MKLVLLSRKNKLLRDWIQQGLLAQLIVSAFIALTVFEM